MNEETAIMTEKEITTEFQVLEIGEVHPSVTNQRKMFLRKEITELADSIKSHGLINPITVRPDQENGGYIIIAGEKRYRAHLLAELPTIKATIVYCSEEEALELQMIENLHRSDIHPMEEAEGYNDLMKKAYSVQMIAQKLAKSVSYVAKRLQLLTLSKELKRDFKQNKFTLAHALVLARLNSEQQERMYKELYVYGGNARHLSDLQRTIAQKFFLDLSDATFDTTDETLLEDTPSCLKCQKRTGANKSLFDDIKDKDTCTDHVCFKKKLLAHISKAVEATKKDNQPMLRLAFEPTKKPGVVSHFFMVKPEEMDKCKTHRQGIIVSNRISWGERSNEKYPVGLIIDVCIDPECPIHGKAYKRLLADKKKEEWEAKNKDRIQRINSQVENRLNLTLSKTLAHSLPVLPLPTILKEAINLLANKDLDNFIVMMRQDGLEVEYRDIEQKFTEYLKDKTSAEDLQRVFFRYLYLDSVDNHSSFGRRSASRMKKDASDAQIDVAGLRKAIKKEVEAEFAEKEKQKNGEQEQEDEDEV